MNNTLPSSVLLFQHEYAITARVNAQGDTTACPILYTNGVMPCVTAAVVFQDDNHTAALMHFSAHRKGTPNQVKTHIENSWQHILNDAATDAPYAVYLIGGMKHWGHGRSAFIAESVLETIHNDPRANLVDNRLFQNVQSIAIDSRTGTILFADEADAIAASHINTIAHMHIDYAPEQPLFKHVIDGRYDTL